MDVQFWMRFRTLQKKKEKSRGNFHRENSKIVENEICSFVSLEIQYNYFLAFRLENLAPTPSANPHRARRGAGALFLPPQIELD
jgi:hypothetical protein